MSQNRDERIAYLQNEIAKQERIAELKSKIALQEGSAQSDDKASSGKEPFFHNTKVQDEPAIKLARHALAGFATGLQDTGNNLTDAINWMMHKTELPAAGVFDEQPDQKADFYKMFGVENEPWYTPAGAVQGIAEYAAPGKLASKGVQLLNAGKRIPQGMKYGKQIGNTLDNAIAGALTNMLGNENPNVENTTESAVGGALIPHLVTGAIAAGKKTIAGARNLPNSIKNFILSQTEKSAERGSAHTPLQTEQNIAENFTNTEGERMPIDFGTATNMPSAKSAYDKTAMVPFSGAAENRNIIQNQTADLAVKKAEEALADAEKYAVEVRGMSAEDIAKQSQNIGETKAAYEKTNSAHEEATQAHEGISKVVDQAPSIVNNLIKEVPKGTSVPEYVSNETRKVFQGLRNEAAADYRALDASQVEMPPEIPGEAKFPSYKAEADALNEERESLTNLFGNDADLPRDIRKELDVSHSLISNEQNLPIKLTDLRTHLSNLGKLWQRAKESGNANVARMIINMRSALQKDTKDFLQYNGHQEELDLWNNANDKWTQSAKFLNSNNMGKVVGNKTTKTDHVATGAGLAKELHDPNNSDVMAMLPLTTQKAAGNLLLTGDKMKAKWAKPEDILSNIGNLKSTEFDILKAHSPEEASYLENLKANVERREALAVSAKELAKKKKELAKTIDRIQSPPGHELATAKDMIGKREAELKEANNKRLLGNNVPSGTGRNIGRAIAGGAGVTAAIAPAIGLPILGIAGSGVVGSRLLQKLLTNPELIDKYIAGEKFPLKKAGKAPDLAGALTKLIMGNK